MISHHITRIKIYCLLFLPICGILWICVINVDQKFINLLDSTRVVSFNSFTLSDLYSNITYKSNYQRPRNVWKSGNFTTALSSENIEVITLKGYQKLKNQTSLSNKNIQYIVNPHSFDYIILEKNICSSIRPDVYVLIFIHSAPSNFHCRKSIRETWGNQSLCSKLKIAIVFIMGKVEDNKTQPLIQFESERYHDIIQETFIDCYKNLTYKVIAGLKWVSNYCPQADFIVKMDDDILTNVFNLISYLHNFKKEKSMENYMILCNVWSSMVVMRDNRSKWFVSREEFKDDRYPQYCSGAAYILSAKTVPALYQVSLETPIFKIDDYYVTGILARAINATLYKLNTAYSLYEWFTVLQEKLINNGIFAHVPEYYKLLYIFWANILPKYENMTFL